MPVRNVQPVFHTRRTSSHLCCSSETCSIKHSICTLGTSKCSLVCTTSYRWKLYTLVSPSVDPIVNYSRRQLLSVSPSATVTLTEMRRKPEEWQLLPSALITHKHFAVEEIIIRYSCSHSDYARLIFHTEIRARAKVHRIYLNFVQ